jgi:D-tyrosyl-tRNA(Tyr) deacylase
MRILLQRVSRASVTVESETTGAIGSGLLAYVGVASTDTLEDVDYLSEKLSTIRLFPDHRGRFDQSVTDVAGSVLIVSQFTLYADTKRGRRPRFSDAASPDVAEPLIQALTDRLHAGGLHIESGRFGTMMEVNAVNDGPVNIMLDSADRYPRQKS